MLEQPTQPAEDVAWERLVENLTRYHARRLRWEAPVDFKAVLLGRRAYIHLWGNGTKRTVQQSDLSEILLDALPDDWLAKAMVLILDGEDALRQDLKSQLEPAFNQIVDDFIQCRAEELAVLDADGEVE